MSKSYKKTPAVVPYLGIKKNQKRLANKRVRKAEDLPFGNNYRKLYDNENLKTASTATYPEFLEQYARSKKLQKKLVTEEQRYNYWKRHYIGK